MNIYICGNPLVDNDSMPFKILEGLKARFPDVNFLEYDPTENFPEENPVYIIDTVLGIKDVVKISDINRYEMGPHVSVHDADLAFQMNFLRKLGKLPEVVVFGVPEKGDEEKIMGDLSNYLKGIP